MKRKKAKLSTSFQQCILKLHWNLLKQRYKGLSYPWVILLLLLLWLHSVNSFHTVWWPPYITYHFYNIMYAGVIQQIMIDNWAKNIVVYILGNYAHYISVIFCRDLFGVSLGEILGFWMYKKLQSFSLAAFCMLY